MADTMTLKTISSEMNMILITPKKYSSCPYCLTGRRLMTPIRIKKRKTHTAGE
jgi:hypothetical protein